MARQCNVSGWDSGIRAGYVNGLGLYNNKVTYNNDGFDLNQSVWIDARVNIASNNSGDGVDLDLVDWSTFDTIDASSNLDKGVSINYFDDYNECGVYPNTNITFQNSRADYNGDWGFSIKGTKDSKFINNACQENGAGGWRLGSKMNPCGDLGGTVIDMPNCLPGKRY